MSVVNVRIIKKKGKKQMTEEKFDDWLDDVYPTYQIAGITLYPSQILKNCDPIAYRIALSEIEDDEDE